MGFDGFFPSRSAGHCGKATVQLVVAAAASGCTRCVAGPWRRAQPDCPTSGGLPSLLARIGIRSKWKIRASGRPRQTQRCFVRQRRRRRRRQQSALQLGSEGGVSGSQTQL